MMTRRNRTHWLVLTLAIGGCASPLPQAARPVIPPDADLATRQSLYDDYHLEYRERVVMVLPFWVFRLGEWRRAEGVYHAGQLQALGESYEETRARALGRQAKARLWSWLGLWMGGTVAVGAMTTPVGGFYSMWAMGWGAGVLIPQGVNGEAWTVAYNAALARELNLTVTPTAVSPPTRAEDQRWLRGRVTLDGAMGLSVNSRVDWDHLYAGDIEWGRAKPDAPPLFALGADYALTDQIQLGIRWEPWIWKRVNIRYADGSRDQWRFDSQGLLGRARFLFPVSPTVALATSVGLGEYWLSGAGFTSNYWAPSRALTGSALGMEAQVGLERFLSRSASLYTGIGYRSARIEPIHSSLGGDLLARDRTAAFADLSGFMFQTSWRFSFGAGAGNP